MAIIAVGEKGRVNGSNVNVRVDATTKANRVYYAQLGDVVVIQGQKTGRPDDGKVWLKIKNETRNKSSVGYIRNDFVDPYTDGGDSGGGGTGELTVDEYINNLEKWCNCGWKYGNGYSPTNKTIDCAWYPYKARNDLGAHGCTSEYNSYLSSKGTISDGNYDTLVRGMEVFQQDTTDPAKKGHMGVYAGKVNIGGTVQHAVYQSCSSHKTIATKYNDGVVGDSGPNLTAMNKNWKFWGWSRYVKH